MSATICTFWTAGGPCGEPAVTTFVAAGTVYGECAAHAPASSHTPALAAMPKPRWCRRAACIDEAMGAGRVAHLVGECR